MKRTRKPRADKGTKRARAPKKERTIVAGAPLDEDAVHITPDLTRYKVDRKTLTAGGNPSIDIGDATAKLLRGKTLEEVYKIAARYLDQTAEALAKKYAHLNEGQRRMVIGNRLRGAARRAAKEKK